MAQGYIRPNAGTDQCRLTTIPDTLVGATFCGWVRRKTARAGQYQPVFWSGANAGLAFVFVGWDSDDLFVLLTNIAGGSHTYTMVKPADDEWIFVALDW